MDDVIAHAAMIQPYLREENQDPALWFDGRQEEDELSPSKIVFHTGVVEDGSHYGSTACVFLRDDHKCGLQVAADQNGQHPWRFKPFYCILHPLDLDEEGRITLDSYEALSEEEGSCLRPSKDAIPLVETFEPELRYLLGNRKYRQLLKTQPQNRPGDG